MKKKILVQGEANNNLKEGSSFFFYTEEQLKIGDMIIAANDSTTMRTNAYIEDKRKNMYHAIVVTDDPIENRLDLTRIL